MFKGSGIIKYDPPRGDMKRRVDWWCIIQVDKEITRYYRYWVDKMVLNPLNMENCGLNLPSWNAHISVIRGEKPSADKMHLWKKYDGMRVDFTYSHVVKNVKEGHFWTLEVQCDHAKYIRDEFQIPSHYPFHLTIGRTY